jgi:signal transduction histidine kinase
VVRSLSLTRIVHGVLWLVMFAWGGLVHAKSLDLAHPSDQGAVSLTDYFSILQDPTGRLTLEEVLLPHHAQQFRAVHQPAPALALGYTNSAYWLRLELKNTSTYEVQRVLQIASWGISYLDAYIPGLSGEYQLTQTGSARAFQTRLYPSRYFVFPLSLRSHSSVVLYFRAQSMPLNIPATLWEPAAFHQHERNTYIGQSLYFGLALGMVVFNLLLYVALRDRSFLLYVLFVLALGLAIAENTGLGKEFLWQNLPWWTNMASSTLFSWTFATALFFCRNMLGIKELLPRWDKPMQYLGYLYLVLPLLYAVAYAQTAYVSLYFYIATLVFILAVCLRAAYLRQRSAYWFLLAFLGVMAGAMAQVLRYMDLLPVHWSTEYGLQIGSAVQLLLLAFALGDRFNATRKNNAKAKYDAALLATQQQQSEKMQSISQWMASVAKGMQQPVGSVRSAGLQIPLALSHTLSQLPKVFQVLDAPSIDLFVRLVQRGNEQRLPLLPAQAAVLAEKAAKQLERVGTLNALRKAQIMVGLNANTVMANYLPLLRHAQSDMVLETAASMSEIINATNHIHAASDRLLQTAEVLSALALVQPAPTSSLVQIAHSLDQVLIVFQPILCQGCKLTKQYQNIPALPAFAPELIQIWTALLLFVNQRLNENKDIHIGLRRDDKNAVVSVHNSSVWLQDDERNKLLQAMQDEPSAGGLQGLDLDMIRKLLRRHHGRIDIQADPVQGLTLLVYLPYP